MAPPLPPPPPAGAAPSWWQHALVVVFLVATAASLGKETAPGRAVRTLTGPPERALGIWQSWGMFGPNPPLGTSWLRVAGAAPDGSPVAVAPLVGPLPATGLRGLYERPVKLERSMLDGTKTALRTSFAKWRCRQAAAAGRPLARVSLAKETFRTVSPAKRQQQPPPAGAVKWTDFETVFCPRGPAAAP